MDWVSLIFVPQGGKGELADIAASFRKAAPVEKPTRIAAIYKFLFEEQRDVVVTMVHGRGQDVSGSSTSVTRHPDAN